MKFELNAQKRELQGSGASRRLRRAKKVPAIIYGGTAAPELIELDHNELLLALRREAFRSSVISIKLGGSEQPALLRDAQMHPYKPIIMHADFLRVDTAHAIHQKVPLHFLNGDDAPGVKTSGGRVAQILNEVEVECLPQDLPAFIDVDLKDMEAGQSLHVSNLAYPAGVKPVVRGDDLVVVSIIIAKAAAAEGEETAAGAEGEGEGEAAPAA